MGKKQIRWACMFVLLAALPGCKRSDTEALGRIGRKLLERAEVATSGFRDKIEDLTPQPKDFALEDKVLHRLRWEKGLADLKFEVTATGNQIELKGKVKTPEQRQRAVELAEATAGVERVLVSLTMQEGDGPLPPAP